MLQRLIEVSYAGVALASLMACDPATTTSVPMADPGIGAAPGSGDGGMSSASDGGLSSDAAVAPPGQQRDAGTTADGSNGDDGGEPDAGDGSGPMRCNGHTELCERPYDEVAYAATHNSHSSTELGYTVFTANQNHALPRQLADGVRALLMDVYEQGDETVLCHSVCLAGSQPHLEALGNLARFLENNPHEVVTIIYQNDVDPARVAQDVTDAGLEPLTYAHSPGSAWPTLREMIEANTRLVITLEHGGGPPAWLHHVWDVAFDTPYSFDSAEDFSCELNRGSADNDLFLLNHWVGNAVGLPSESGAREVNAYDVLLGRAQQCMTEHDALPNFVAVDFYDHGDLIEVVDTLNGV